MDCTQGRDRGLGRSIQRWPVGEGPVSLQFPGIGTYALIEGSWHEVSVDRRSADKPVRVILGDRQEFNDFRPSGEADRQWMSDYGVVRLPLDRAEEIVKVQRLGRYRGELVRQLGPVLKGRVMVGLESSDPQVAARVDFGGDQRMFGFTKQIEVTDFDDVVEEVTVRYRRGEGAVDG